MEVVELAIEQMQTADENETSKDEVSTSTNPLYTKTYKKLNSTFNLDNFLENEQKNNKLEPWCKLDKTTKLKKLAVFTQQYTIENSLSEEETTILSNFFKESLDRKKFQRVKDVIYDKDNGLIKSIPALTYSKPTKHFTLRNMDKRVSTSKSLAPKKSQTIRNKKEKEKEQTNDCVDDDDDDDEM